MSNLSTYRYELKYALNPREYLSFLHILHLHPSGFTRAFPDRQINNIYFDNINYQLCQENLSGISNRKKIRYRWYGNNENFNQGKLEEKIKTNSLGKKKYHALDKPETLSNLVIQSKTSLNRPELIPTLHNAYLRSYFIDRTSKFRLTIDRNIKYWLPTEGLHNKFSSIDEDRFIIELKFDKDQYKEFSSISACFPFRLSKHSKYVSGLFALLY